MDKLPQMLTYLDSSLQKMKTIVNELVQSRWNEHPHSASEELIDLQNILEDVKLTLAQQIAEAKATIHYQLDASELNFARRNLRSIMYNLINNAIKYRSTDRKLEIMIKSYLEDDFVVISVADNGIGIEKDKHELIFNKFQRLKDDVEGNGVGLYLVRELLQTAGGEIYLESEPGKGAEFKIFLPRRKAGI